MLAHISQASCIFSARFPFGFPLGFSHGLIYFWADFILVVGGVVHDVAAAFAA
jgi:hypothetical protein